MTDQERYLAWCIHWCVTPEDPSTLRRIYLGQRDDGSPQIEAEWRAKLAHRRSAGPTLHQGEIYDYKSVLDGEHVHSRHQHHEHMRKHNVFEVGNEIDTMVNRPEVPMPDMRERMAHDYDVAETMEKRGELS
jgi:hypothetical protein